MQLGLCPPYMYVGSNRTIETNVVALMPHSFACSRPQIILLNAL